MPSPIDLYGNWPYEKQYEVDNPEPHYLESGELVEDWVCEYCGEPYPDEADLEAHITGVFTLGLCPFIQGQLDLEEDDDGGSYDGVISSMMDLARRRALAAGLDPGDPVFSERVFDEYAKLMA